MKKRLTFFSYAITLGILIVLVCSLDALALNVKPLDTLRVKIVQDVKQEEKVKQVEQIRQAEKELEENTQKVASIEDIIKYTNGEITKTQLEENKSEIYVGNEENLKILKTIINETNNLENVVINEKVEKAETKVSTFEELKEKIKYKDSKNTKVVFLAPSTQWKNLYAIGNTNEGKVMNEIMDIIENKLSKIDEIKTIRNDPSKQVLGYIADANKENIDLYFSLHSNASQSKLAQGPVIFSYPDSKESLKFANIVYEKLLEIYPNPEEGRGVKTNNAYYELANIKVPSIITEIAFHDNVEDAEWILQNKEIIAEQLVKAIVEYFK